MTSALGVYQRLGYIVIGVRRPGIEPSPYEFDQFDESVVDYCIDNDGTVEDLAAKIDAVIHAYGEWRRAA